MATLERSILSATVLTLLVATLLASGGFDSIERAERASEICATALGRDWVCVDIG